MWGILLGVDDMGFEFGFNQPEQSKSVGMIILTMVLALGLVGSTTLLLVQSQQITALEEQVTTLETELSDLQAEFSNLFSDYDTLREAFEEPLEDPITPTIDQVRGWLAVDDTDECPYEDGVWTCGDYAAMLMTRVKEKNWRIRIAVVSYSLDGDSSYGVYNQPYGRYGHAFNVIECTDGIWYIEPQSDATWYFVNNQDERSEFRIHWYYDLESSTLGTQWDGDTISTNYYNQFA